MKLTPLMIAVSVAGLSAGCATNSGGNAEVRESEGPGLSVGQHAPDATVYTQSGEAVSLADLYKDGPIVVTFYRGGWCPFCERALGTWQTKLPELQEAGGTLVALTPESPDHAEETIDEHGLGFDVYSDSTMEAAKAFNVFFELDPDTKRKYKRYGIDLSTWNANGAWTLPAPGTFVIDRDGVIRYAWADWDYKLRADPDEVIDVVRSLQ